LVYKNEGAKRKLASDRKVYEAIYCSDFSFKIIYNIFKQTDLNIFSVLVGLKPIKNKMVVISAITR